MEDKNMAKRQRKSTGKKRTISPEHLAKMQEGKQAKQRYRERMEGLSELETRLRKGARAH